MRIKPEEVLKVAALARLSLTEDETEAYTREFDDILSHFAVIDEYDLSGDQATYDQGETMATLRKDEPQRFQDQEKLHQNVKAMKDGLIVVPKILE